MNNLNGFQDKIKNDISCGHSCWEHSLLHCLNLMFLCYFYVMSFIIIDQHACLNPEILNSLFILCEHFIFSGSIVLNSL